MRVGRYVLPRSSPCRARGARRKARHWNHTGGARRHHHPVELAVYDNDGQEGIFIPGSMEANAAKEVAANWDKTPA